jgi:hypothetical protein
VKWEVKTTGRRKVPEGIFFTVGTMPHRQPLTKRGDQKCDWSILVYRRLENETCTGPSCCHTAGNPNRGELDLRRNMQNRPKQYKTMTYMAPNPEAKL